MENMILQQPLLLLFVLVALCLFALIMCSRFLIEGGVALGHQLNISPLIIGTIIIGMGTSIDELMVNVSSLYLSNSSEIIMGNIIGSNIANITLGLGIPALITTIVATNSVIKKEIPTYLGLSVIFTVFCVNGRLTQFEGLILIMVFVITSFLVFQSFKTNSGHVKLIALHTKTHLRGKPITKNLFQVFGSLAIMLLGSRILVATASGIALKFGVNSYIISLVIVGLGTSLPEILASVQAAIRKNSDIVLGNVLGSNIFNLCFGLGIPLLIKPVAIDFQSLKDVYFLNLLTIVTVLILFLDLKWLGYNKKINVVGGILLILGFLFFVLKKMMVV